MSLKDWAAKWGVPHDALLDLYQQLNFTGCRDSRSRVTTESGAQREVQLEASQAGGVLWRNNVGAGVLDNGSYVRWGLANESKEMNKRLKSSDLIGIRPILITQAWVGYTVGQFVAREIKEPGWIYSGRGREEAQMNYLLLAKSFGADARFATGRGTL